ncbi:MAG: amidohydrolase family protein [Candidatus Methylomirabilia bacterium]
MDLSTGGAAVIAVPSRVDLSDLPVVDGHCHPLLPDPWAIAVDQFRQLFSEARPGMMTTHIQQTLYFQRALRELAEWLGSAATVEAVLGRRAVTGADGSALLLREERVGALLVDTGYPPAAMSVAEMRRLLPVAIHEIFRVETCAEGFLPKALPYAEFLEAFTRELRAARSRAVALKSIIAYRSGLEIAEWEPERVARAYDVQVARIKAGGSSRLTEKPLLDTLVLLALDVAGETGCPLQLHTGIGDPDIDLLQANPLLLRPTLEHPRWSQARIVLLHMAYPYVREAAFVAAVWPQVYVDLSLALPFLGPGALLPLIETLSLAPVSKLTYGSDLGGLPELFALSARWGRAALGEALSWLVERRGMTAEQARVAGRQILAETARALYRLPPAE